MKNRIYTTLLAGALTLATATVANAMSQFLTLSAAPLWPTSSTPASDLLYNVTSVGRGGSGLLEVTLTGSGMPAGVTVTFSPSVLRFTGNQLTTQTATMTVHCPYPLPLDCYPFVITGTSLRGTISITNMVMFTPSFVAVRAPTLYLDNLGNSSLRLRGLGATAKTYQIQAKANLTDSIWTPLGSASADGNGRFTFFSSMVTNAPTCFYRALEQ